MNRVRKAWLALMGRLEPEVREVKVEVVREVYGEAQEAEVYRAVDPRQAMHMRAYAFGGIPFQSDIAEWNGRYFATCEQAFKECPGAEVVSEKVWRIGGRLYKGPTLAHIKVQPKPKRAKGRK